MGDGGHRTQPWERAPKPVTSAQMGRVQSARLATVEALCQVMRVPEVQVPDLRALYADNAEEVFSKRNRGSSAPKAAVPVTLIERSRSTLLGPSALHQQNGNLPG